MGEAKSGGSVLQAYLEVVGAKHPVVTFLESPKKGDGIPANLIELSGAVFDGNNQFNEHQAWTVCGRIAELCRKGHEVETSVNYRNAACENLNDARVILGDCRGAIRDEDGVSYTTFEALISAVMDKIGTAMKCLGFTGAKADV